MGPFMRFMWWAARKEFIVTGLENLPKCGPGLLAVNQTGHFDPLLLAVAIPRPMHFVSLNDKNAEWYAPLLFSCTGGINLSGNLVKGGGKRFVWHIEDAREYGELIAIFPEGRLERKEPPRTEIISFHKSVATIARLHKIPVIPALLRGTDKVLPDSTAKLLNFLRFRPAHVHLRIGVPISPEDIHCAEDVRQAIINLEGSPLPEPALA